MFVSNDPEVLVVGGGLGGLTVAALTARSGRRVRILEKASVPGGRARTEERNGFHFNLGAHALYRGGEGIGVLKKLDIEPSGGVPRPVRPLGIRGGKFGNLPTGLLSLAGTRLFGVATKLEVARLLSLIPKISTETIESVSVSDWVETNLSRPESREFLLALVRVASYTNAPDLQSAGAAIAQIQSALRSNVLYLDGGWQRLVDGLRGAATSSGVEIRTAARARSITSRSDKGPLVVQLDDGSEIAAEIVVLATPLDEASDLLSGNWPGVLEEFRSTATPVRVASLDVALDRLPVAGNVFALGMDQPLYFSVHSEFARLAPENGALVHLLKYLPVGHRESPKEIKHQFEFLLDSLQPGWRDHIVHTRFLPDLMVASALASVRSKGTRGRPGVQVDETRGLFLVGDWVGKRGMLADATLASADEVAGIISRRKASPLRVAV